MPGLAKRAYKPGEEGEILANIDLASERGRFRTRITVNSNDPKNPSVDLDVRSFVVPDPQVSPDVLNLGTLDVGSSVRRSLKVRLPASPSQPNPAIVAVHTPLPALSCKPLPSSQRVEAGIVYDVLCELHAPVPVGPIDGEIKISYKSVGRDGVSFDPRWR